jgi:hypothetical protein
MALPHRMGSVKAPTIRRVPPQRGQTSTSTAKPVWSTACHRMNWRPTRDALLAYPWPGNVRELGNVEARVVCATC